MTREPTNVLPSLKELSEVTTENECARPVTTGSSDTSPEKKIKRLTKPRVIFFGNGPLATFTLTTLQPYCDIIFHAKTAADLTRVAEFKRQSPEAHGILASFGTIIKPDLLKLFEPEGILNLHPSLLPKYRGASPIESAILAGDTNFSYSIMKLIPEMDAGPIFHQATLHNLPINKSEIYQALAKSGAQWIIENLNHLPKPTPQDDIKATYTTKLNKSMSFLQPDQFPAKAIFRQIVAYQNYPKPKYTFYNKTCIILDAHVLRVTDILCEAAGINGRESSPLFIKCSDRNFIVIDRLQPEGKKPMTASAFINGYAKNQKTTPESETKL